MMIDWEKEKYENLKGIDVIATTGKLKNSKFKKKQEHKNNIAKTVEKQILCLSV